MLFTIYLWKYIFNKHSLNNETNKDKRGYHDRYKYIKNFRIK